MANFDFTTLNYSDLEDLFCDLLNKEQAEDSKIRYKTFKEGKDKGVDILYSSDSNYFDHVGQVKHYFNSGFTLMLDTLKKNEVAKVKKLNPNKYLFATSLDLTVAQTESIKDIFQPYIKSLHDIYGRKDLNTLLDKHPSILRNHFKLWLSSSEVLTAIVNSDLIFRTSDYLSELKKRIRNYVKTPAFETAQASLEKNKLIVITGEPGVGKSTLADMLAFLYVQRGYTFTYIQDNIRDAERVLTDESKHVVYYDDFLGSNDVEINRARASETSLRKIIKRFENQNNNVLILTTRSHLLNSVVSKSENLRRINLQNKESIVTLEEYSLELRITLYNNHVEESDIGPRLKSVLETAEIRNFVVEHPNFFPRSVEYITRNENVLGYSVEQFRQFIYDNFDNPSEIYGHAYNEQIEGDDRLLLNTLMSLETPAYFVDLEMAFSTRVDHEIKTNNKTRDFNAFKKSLKRLDGAFILIQPQKDKVDFINPSLVDFLEPHINQDNDEVSRIVSSVCVTSQLVKLFLSKNKTRKMPAELKQKLLNNYTYFVTSKSPDLDLIKIALVIFKKIDLKESENTICTILEEVDDWNVLHQNYSLNLLFRDFMTAAIPYGNVHKILTKKIMSILTELVLGEYDLEDAADLLERLVNDYHLNLDTADTKEIEEHIDSILTDYVEQEVEALTDDIYDESEADDKRYEIEELIERFTSLGLSIRTHLDEFDIDWNEVSMNNHFRRAMEKD